MTSFQLYNICTEYVLYSFLHKTLRVMQYIVVSCSIVQYIVVSCSCCLVDIINTYSIHLSKVHIHHINGDEGTINHTDDKRSAMFNYISIVNIIVRLRVQFLYDNSRNSENYHIKVHFLNDKFTNLYSTVLKLQEVSQNKNRQFLYDYLLI